MANFEMEAYRSVKQQTLNSYEPKQDKEEVHVLDFLVLK